MTKILENKENEKSNTQSAFDVFTLFVLTIVTLAFRIYNIYLVCSWCSTCIAAIMAALLMIVVSALIHSHIYDYLTHGKFTEIAKNCAEKMLTNCSSNDEIEQLNKISRDCRWAILLTQAAIAFVLKFVIG